MPTEVNKEIELEIAYVPFIDIVSYSKLVTSEQRRLLELLNQIVRSRTFPRLPMQERFREHVIATWRESGGEPRRGGRLPALLADSGFVIRSARPHVFCLRPDHYMWHWPATFIEIYLPRLIEMGPIDQGFVNKVRADLASAERNRNALMLTRLVLEIIAEKAV
jgi:hypothetical protein